MSALSTQSYKGTRDFYPEDMFVQNFIFRTMRDVVEKYGYSEYGASLLEETALYAAKTGEEIVNEQTYSFTDRGGRDVTLRPEMTPSVARLIAQKRKELQLPLRWYSIPNLFRYERPQRGRLREHWQLNVDIFGVDTLDAEVEIITMAHDIMVNFGAKPDSFVIKLNNRKLINYILLEYIGLSDTTATQVSKLIDRMLKMKADEFEDKLNKVLSSDQTEKLLATLRVQQLDELPEELYDTDGFKELQSVSASLQNLGITNWVYDPSLVRGFDYYTGIVFEVFDIHPDNNRSMFGGGRYDDLLSIFDTEPVPAVGFGMGDVTIRDYLETYNLLPEYSSTIQIKVCVLDSDALDTARGLAQNLRRHGISTELDTSYRKPDKLIKQAEKQGIPYMVFVGEEEIGSGTYKLKRLAEHNDYEVTEQEMIEHVQHA